MEFQYSADMASDAEEVLLELQSGTRKVSSCCRIRCRDDSELISYLH
jgi:hypothetical protein